MFLGSTSANQSFVDYDEFGNASKITSEKGSTLSAAKYFENSEYTYVNDSADWKLGLPASVITIYSKSSADNLPDITLNKVWTYYANGALNSETVMPNGDQQSQTVSTLFTYDEFGNKVKELSCPGVSDPNLCSDAVSGSRSSSFVPDITGTYIQESSNSVGHTTKVGIDLGLGATTSLTDANALTTAFSIDELGRPKTISYPDGKVSRIAREWCGGNVSCPGLGTHVGFIREMNETSGEPEKTTFLDQNGTTYRSHTVGWNGTEIIEGTIFDNRGRKVKSLNPHFAGEPEFWRENKYDDLDRLVETTYPDAEGVTQSNTISYSGLQTTFYEAKGRSKKEFRDASGSVVRMEDALGTPIDFELDAKSRVVSTVVNGDQSTKLSKQYDALDRVIMHDDPSSGRWTYTYSPFGDAETVTSKVSLRNPELADIKQSMTYDKIGRIISRQESIGEATVQLSDWAYDIAAGAGVGLVASEKTSGSYGKHQKTYAYTNLGAVAEESTKTGENEFAAQLSFDYDNIGRLEYIHYPNDLSIRYQYNQYGYLSSVNNGPASLWSAIESDAFNNLEVIDLGNGFSESRLFSAANGALTDMLVSDLGGNPEQHFYYKYDEAGMLIERGNAVSIVSEIYQYDDLYRLSSVAATTETSIVNYNFSYDALGNMLSNSSAAGAYQYNCGAGPYAVCAVGGTRYQYDELGNIVQVVDASDVETFTAEYTPYNKPSRLDSVYFSYGPNRNRVSRSDGSTSKTFYVASSGQKYYEVTESSGSSEFKSLIYANSEQPFAVATGLEEHEINYYHRDHQGSVVATSDDTGAGSVEVLGYTPFGHHSSPTDATIQNADSSPSVVGNLGYTGHEEIRSLDLIHMNGRVYDPKIARFLSPDPYITDPNDTQSYNSYSYVHNNPMNHHDPSGYIVDTLADIGFIAYDLYSIVDNYLSGNDEGLAVDMLALGADVAALAVPFATGGGLQLGRLTMFLTKVPWHQE